MTFPDLTPTDRTGDPRCGWHPNHQTPTCDAPATWHVAWWLAPKADFSLLCDEHMAAVQHDLVYVDRHPAETACDMPGTGWLLAEPSRCVPVTTEDLASARRGEAASA